MSDATLLFVDNDRDFLETRSEFLEQAGYQVFAAASPEEARGVLARDEIDLAILDIRLRDDDDEKDTSGLTLAKELERTLPKIMLTNYPTVDAAREALRPQLDGLPIAVTFVSKQEGHQALIQAVQNTLGPLGSWLKRVQQAVEGTDNELKQDYKNAQKQAAANFGAAFVVAMIGILIIFTGIVLAFIFNESNPKCPEGFQNRYIGIVGTVTGLITEAVSLLFFKRVDAANKRMDKYHDERIQGRHFDMLLNACEGLTSATKRGRCRELTIHQAVTAWLGSALGDISPSEGVEVNNANTTG